jgi:cytochrome c biogenesis protein CcdA
LISATSSVVALVFPSVGLVVGVLLIASGSYFVAGGSAYSSFGDQMAQRFGGLASRPGLVGYAAYGFAYGLASLGCTLPIFLSVVSGGQLSPPFWIMTLQFVLYGLGLGVVLSGLTLAATLFDFGVLRNVHRLGRFIPSVSALLLLITGAYVSFYWLTAGGVLEHLVSRD